MCKTVKHSSRRRVHNPREQTVVQLWDFWPHGNFLGGPEAVTIVNAEGFEPSF